MLVYRRSWLIFVSGFFEPFFYLLSIGVGLNKLVGALHVGNTVVAYTAYVAPGLLASSAMNGALFDATFNMFFRLKVAKTYDAILSTPLGTGDVALGELAWSLHPGLDLLRRVHRRHGVVRLRAVTMGDPLLPRGGAHRFRLRRRRAGGDVVHDELAGLRQGVARHHPDVPFSATFYPLTVYPGWLQLVVRCTPLYQAVALERGLDAGALSLSLVGHSAYLAVLGVAGLTVTSRRLARLLLP